MTMWPTLTPISVVSDASRTTHSPKPGDYLAHQMPLSRRSLGQVLHALIPHSLGKRGYLRCEAPMNSITGPGRPGATYLRDWRTLGGIRPSGLAFFSECHPVHTRRSPGTGWSD